MKMKVAILFTILCIATYSRAETVCECRTYFTSDQTSPVYTIPDRKIPDCSTCQKICGEAIGQVTNGGDLSHTTSSGATVGQIACKTYNKDITNGQLAAFSKCGTGGWVKGTNAKGILCCKAGSVC